MKTLGYFLVVLGILIMIGTYHLLGGIFWCGVGIYIISRKKSRRREAGTRRSG